MLSLLKGLSQLLKGLNQADSALAGPVNVGILVERIALIQAMPAHQANLLDVLSKFKAKDGINLTKYPKSQQNDYQLDKMSKSCLDCFE